MPAEKIPTGDSAPRSTAWDNMTVPRNSGNTEADKAQKIQSIYKNSEKFRNFIESESMDFDSLSDADKTKAYEKYNNIEVGSTMRSKEQWKWIPDMKDAIDAAGGIDNVSDLQLGQLRAAYLESFKPSDVADKEDDTAENDSDAVDETDTDTSEGDESADESAYADEADTTEEEADTSEEETDVDTETDETDANDSEEGDEATDESEDEGGDEAAEDESEESDEERAERVEKEKRRSLFKRIGAAAAMTALLVGGGMALNKANKTDNSVKAAPATTASFTDENIANGGSSINKEVEQAVQEAAERMENLDIAGHYNIDNGYANKDNTGPNPDKLYVGENGETRGEYKMANFKPIFEEWLNSGEDGNRDDKIITEKLFEIMENQPECASMVRGMLQTIGYEKGDADFNAIEKNTEGSKEGYQETMNSVEDFFSHVTKVEPGAAYGYCTNFYMRSAFDGSELDSSKIELVKDLNWNEAKPADGDYNVMVFTAVKDGETYTLMIKGECVQGLLGAKYDIDIPPVEVTTPPVTTTETTHPTETTTVTTETTPSSTTTTVETTNPDESTTTSTTTTRTSTTTTSTTTTETTSTTTKTSTTTSTTPITTTTTEYTTTTTKITDLTTTPVTTTTTIETTPVTTTVVNKNQEDLARAMGDHAQQEQTKEEASERPDPAQYNFDANTGYFVNPQDNQEDVGPKPFEEIIKNADKNDAAGNDMTEQVVKADEALPPVFTVTDNQEAEKQAQQAAETQKPADASDARGRFGRRP